MAEVTQSFSFKILTPEDKGEKDPETGEVSPSLSAEVNAADNPTPDGKGTTEAVYGKPIYFRVYTQPIGLPYAITSSDGSVAPLTGDGRGSTGEVEDKITFTDKNEATSSKVIKDGKLIFYEYFGRSLGYIGVVGNNVLRATDSGVAVAKVKYTTEFQLHSLTVPNRGIDGYEVIVYIKSTEQEASKEC